VKLRVEGNIANHKTVPHGGIYSTGRGFDRKIIDFSSNVNPLGYPNSIKIKLKQNYDLFSIYPDTESTTLRNYLARYTGISKDQITVGNGATEIIYNFCKAFLKGHKILIPIPTFGEYESAAKLHGASVNFLKIMNLNQEIPKLLNEISKNDCVFICNPNNPTGVLTKRKNMLKIVEFAHKKSILVFVDECFIELVSIARESLVPHLRKFDNLFILRSLTKSFGLAGLRVGYGLGSREIISILDRIKIPWNVNGLAQNIAKKALSDKSHLRKTRKIISQERKFLRDAISKINGFTCYDSDANFLLIKSKINSKQLQNKLLKKNILVRDCSTFKGLDSKFIRVAIRTHKENRRLVKALKTI
jgi:threonine-phosphate decarboxylase